MLDICILIRTSLSCSTPLDFDSLMGVASPKPEVGSSWKSSTLLVLNERIIRKIAEYPSYMSAFFDILAKIDQKSTFFGKKRPKTEIFGLCLVAPLGARKF